MRMKIIQPSYEILTRDEQRGGLAIIERAARTCYRSEDAIAEGSAERLVKSLIRRGHLSVIEHGAYAFEIIDEKLFEVIVHGLCALRKQLAEPPRITATHVNGRMIISGNCRAWRELTALSEEFISGGAVAMYFIPYIDRAYIGDICDVTMYGADERIKPMTDAKLLKDPAQARIHMRQTVRFVIDRGVSHEFVRHRKFSFSQESTRYCNYSQGRFGSEITVIEPCYLTPGTVAYDFWEDACRSAERDYMRLIKLQRPAQEARAVLPISTKTELVMTGTFAQWEHFFDLRARQLTGAAHPQAVEVAQPLMREMAVRFPHVMGGEPV